jgi:5-methyltetrahydrofolate--homocysteine methyltransferase
MKRVQLLNTLAKKVLVLDGATGTELYKHGMPAGACPEKWCLENPKVTASIHSAYSASGSDIVYSSTFGANRVKLRAYGIKDVVGINKELALIAKDAVAKKALVAGDIGSTGKFVKPFGSLEFEEAVDIFKEQAKGLLLGKVDLFVIETMMDIQEARAALLAVRELSDKFTIVTMTFEKSGRTLNGNDPQSALITLQSLGADAFGCNCSSGPQGMLKIISLMKPYATVPLVAKPNAGMPSLANGKTTFEMSALEFARLTAKLVSSGANLVGGCCGTHPEHIKQLKKAILNKKPIAPYQESIAALSSARGAFIFRKKVFTIVGEKINPTGKKKLQQELKRGNLALLSQLAGNQQQQGAKILDVNVSMPKVEEKKLMLKAISTLAVCVELPLAIDSSNPKVIKEALRFYPGRALINSLSAEKHRLKTILPLAKKYGAMFILLPIAGREVPLTFKKRKKIIQKAIKEAKKVGFSDNDIIIDGLVMAVSSFSGASREALKTIEWCSNVLKYKSIVGLSNISFGLPGRHLINRAFLTLAKAKGLNSAIADPSDNRQEKNKLAIDLLLNKKKASLKFINKYSRLKAKQKVGKIKVISLPEQIAEAILEGNSACIAGIVKQALKDGVSAFVLIEKYMIPAIIKVGELFERKEYFLPQLIASAQSMKRGVKILKPLLKDAKFVKIKKAVIMLATVEGDIHDIGKNIVALLLENHGFEIIDLGKDVSAQKIIQEIKHCKPDIVGLSALMTTTMVNMREVIALAKKEGLKCKFMAGGAVVNKAYADSIGATYAKDGVEAVRIAKDLTAKKSKASFCSYGGI